MERIAVFPGTFDPITRGHEAIILRALPLFDKIIIAIGNNSGKNTLFSLEQRTKWIRDLFVDVSKIEVTTYEGLTVQFCQSVNAGFILRGLRSTVDFEYEKAISQMNLALDNKIETVFLITDPSYSAISSTIVRDVFRHGGDITQFVPKTVKPN